VEVDIMITHAEALHIKLLEIIQGEFRQVVDVDAEPLQDGVAHSGGEGVVDLADPVLAHDLEAVESLVVVLQ
jgi:hypothetical protein